MRPLLTILFLLLPLTLWPQEPLDVVSFDYRPPTLVVNARVDGSEPLPFAFDTGATTCLLDVEVARRLGIEPAEQGRRGPVGVVRASIAIGRAVAHDLEVVIRDLQPLSEQAGVELAGIVGFTWMENFVFELDYPARRLRLWPRSYELSAPAGHMVLPLALHSAPKFSGASIHVPASVDGERCPMMLDTGAARGVLGDRVASRLGVNLKPIHSAEQGGGLPTHVVRRLYFAGRLFTNVRFTFDPRRGQDGAPYNQCVIGNEQLQAFGVTIDIPHRRAVFAPVLPVSPPE